jgi:hypothetical protein
MNREIKFRGKQKGWLYGGISIFDGIHRIHTNKGDYIVTPESIGQFISILDSNNKEIYEGDLVEMNGNVYLIKYNKLHCQYSLFTPLGQSRYEIVCDICDRRGNPPTKWIDSSLTIVGNIIDNSDIYVPFKEYRKL